MEKPITMTIEETKRDIVGIINNSKLPTFILETIIKDIYVEVNQIATQQANLEKQKYEEAISQSKRIPSETPRISAERS